MIRWPHVPIVEVIRATQELLQEKSNGTYVGGHRHSHGSKSGECLVVWPERGSWYCSSCKNRGDVVDWLIGAGKLGDTVIESRSDAIAYLTNEYGESPYEWQEPVPFPDIVGPPCPLDVLPRQLERFITEQTDALQVPRDLMMSLVLGVISAITAPRARGYASGAGALRLGRRIVVSRKALDAFLDNGRTGQTNNNETHHD